MALALPFGFRPNIINIVGDDYPTGAIDGFRNTLKVNYKGGWRRIKKGNAVLSLCGPARACGFTGILPQKHLMLSNDTGQAFTDAGMWFRTYLADLARVGYVNFVGGKLLNGYGEPVGNAGHFTIPTPFPQIGIHKAHIIYGSPQYGLGAAGAGNGNQFIDENGTITGDKDADVGDSFYYPDMWGRDVEAFITSRLSKPGEPWSVYIGDKASHVPITPATRYVGTPITYADNAGFGVGTGQPQFIIDQQVVPWDATAIANAHATKLLRLQTLYASDDSLKHLLDFLDTNGLLSTTMIIWRCDQTDFSGEAQVDGGKGTQHKASNFLEMYVRPPGPAGGSNFDCEQAVCDMDVASTIRHVCGAASHYMEDGMSIVPILLDNNAAFREATPYFNPTKNPECEGLNFANGVRWGRGVAGGHAAGQEYNWTDEWCTVNTGANPANAAKLQLIKNRYGLT